MLQPAANSVARSAATSVVIPVSSDTPRAYHRLDRYRCVLGYQLTIAAVLPGPGDFKHHHQLTGIQTAIPSQISQIQAAPCFSFFSGFPLSYRCCFWCAHEILNSLGPPCRDINTFTSNREFSFDGLGFNIDTSPKIAAQLYSTAVKSCGNYIRR
ncbi:hypothetical protein NDU88_007734 [Pleurodeles waltl]|uniref:Uncharacterized protein n=1 Tax=Pleurodeles waltl TaxID=8319 RepID=A0AAV7N313_PLEWA|nr:hypothetical protein NDU88_007734 [Pleurodeles waltl]